MTLEQIEQKRKLEEQLEKRYEDACKQTETIPNEDYKMGLYVGLNFAFEKLLNM